MEHRLRRKPPKGAGPNRAGPDRAGDENVDGLIVGLLLVVVVVVVGSSDPTVCNTNAMTADTQAEKQAHRPADTQTETGSRTDPEALGRPDQIRPISANTLSGRWEGGRVGKWDWEVGSERWEMGGGR